MMTSVASAEPRKKSAAPAAIRPPTMLPATRWIARCQVADE
jgi:hypothetical protein